MLPRDRVSKSWVIDLGDEKFLETWSEFEARQALERGLVVRTAHEHLVFVNEGFAKFADCFKEEEK